MHRNRKENDKCDELEEAGNSQLLARVQKPAPALFSLFLAL